ncbi:MAG: hypothetical protein WAS21_02560 [Geminicoccaceae bacterium]
MSIGAVTKFGSLLQLDSGTRGVRFASFEGFKPRATDRHFVCISGEHGTGPYRVTITERC